MSFALCLPDCAGSSAVIVRNLCSFFLFVVDRISCFFGLKFVLFLKSANIGLAFSCFFSRCYIFKLNFMIVDPNFDFVIKSVNILSTVVFCLFMTFRMC